MTHLKKSIFTLIVLSVAAGSAAAETAAETSVKAAIVHKISKFVAWPEGTFATDEEPIRFCVVGDASVLEALKKMRDRQIHGRHVEAAAAPDPTEVAASCDVLYLGNDSARNVEEWTDRVNGEPILTFGETGGYGDSKSIVSVMVRRNKVRFEINLDANRGTGLRIGAQLLQLAAAVGGRGA